MLNELIERDVKVARTILYHLNHMGFSPTGRECVQSGIVTSTSLFNAAVTKLSDLGLFRMESGKSRTVVPVSTAVAIPHNLYSLENRFLEAEVLLVDRLAEDSMSAPFWASLKSWCPNVKTVWLHGYTTQQQRDQQEAHSGWIASLCDVGVVLGQTSGLDTFIEIKSRPNPPQHVGVLAHDQETIIRAVAFGFECLDLNLVEQYFDTE